MENKSIESTDNKTEDIVKVEKENIISNTEIEIIENSKKYSSNENEKDDENKEDITKSNDGYADDEFDFVDAEENNNNKDKLEIKIEKENISDKHLDEKEIIDSKIIPDENKIITAVINEEDANKDDLKANKIILQNSDNKNDQSNYICKEKELIDYHKKIEINSNNKPNEENLIENNYNLDSENKNKIKEYNYPNNKEELKNNFDLVDEKDKTIENNSNENDLENNSNKETPISEIVIDKEEEIIKRDLELIKKDTDEANYLEEQTVEENENQNQNEEIEANKIDDEIKKKEEFNNDEFDFYEASEENKEIEVNDKNKILIDENEKSNIELNIENEKIEDKNHSNENLENNEIPTLEKKSEDLEKKEEDKNNLNENDDLDFKEIEESNCNEEIPVELYKKKVINDNNLNLESQKDNTELNQEFIENIENDENRNDFRLENHQEDKKKETEIDKDKISKPNEKIENNTQLNNENENDEFDFVDETEENVDTENIQKENENNNEKLSENENKNREDLNQNNENQNKEFDTKKIMDYSFSSSEDEEDFKKNAKKNIEKNQMISNEQSKIEQTSKEINIDENDNHTIQDVNNIEDNLDNLEFEDCSENNENINEKQIELDNKDNIIKQENKAVEDEDIFDFVEEDNEEPIKNSSNNDNKNSSKNKEEIKKIESEKNDDDFDFVEESIQENNFSQSTVKVNNNSYQLNQNSNKLSLVNKDHINNLINNYRNKFISTNPNFVLSQNSLECKFENNIHQQDVEKNELKITEEESFNTFPKDEFVEEENNSDKKIEIDEDEFLDVENEEEDNQKNNKLNETETNNIQKINTKENINYQKRIKLLSDLESFKFEINESKYEPYDISQQTMGFESNQIKEIYKPISIQKHIENLKYFNSEPEINTKGFSLEELTKLSKYYNTKLNIKITTFNNGILEFPNNLTRKLFFQFSDLRVIINNSASIQFQHPNKNLSPNNLQNYNLTPNNNDNIKDTLKETNNNIENVQNKKSNEENYLTPNNNTNSNVSSINNKESLNTTINMNNTSNNDSTINKDRILENIKELKLTNSKNTDLFDKQNINTNQTAFSPNINSRSNVLSALNDGNSNSNKKEPTKSPNIADKRITIGIDVESNKVKMEMKEQKELDSDSFDEIKEEDDDSTDNKKPKFVMNEMMSSLFMNVSNSNNNNIPSSFNNTIKFENKEESKEENNKEVNENDIFEMLKSMGITRKEEKVNYDKNNEIEKNNEKLNNIIDGLPNLNYMTSKYVEIPNSIFNI